MIPLRPLFRRQFLDGRRRCFFHDVARFWIETDDAGKGLMHGASGEYFRALGVIVPRGFLASGRVTIEAAQYEHRRNDTMCQSVHHI